MTRKTMISFLALTLGSASMIGAPAQAQQGIWSNGYGSNYENVYANSYDNGNNRSYDARNYDDRNYDQRGYERRSHRGNRCSKGTTGTIIGAAAGGLIGSQIAGRRGDRTIGTILGAGLGAVAGRAIDRSGNRNRC